MNRREPSPVDVAATRSDVRRLAVPAFVTLIAEPLFLLADTAIVGHLGTAALAGLGVASAILATAVGLFVFLAYATTAVVARNLGAGAHDRALAAGIDGLWLALLLGGTAALIVGFGAAAMVGAFGATAAASAQAIVYLRISALGLPSMLAVLALVGVLRGLQDTRTPLIVAMAGFGANIVLNVVLVHGVGLGIAGAAWGTVIAQTGMALALTVVVLREARAARAVLSPHLRGVLEAAGRGVPLLVRTLALRGVLLATTWTAARYGQVPLAAYQVAATIWTFLAFALDALAIAGQALIGKALGAGDVPGARATTALMTRWSVWMGVALGLATAALSPVLPMLFTPDPQVRAALKIGLLVVALGQPVAAYAFLLDGVLIGAGDGRWLAAAGVVLLLAYLPVVGALVALRPLITTDGAALAALWAGFLVFMSLRTLALHHRARGDAWLVTGSA